MGRVLGYYPYLERGAGNVNAGFDGEPDLSAAQTFSQIVCEQLPATSAHLVCARFAEIAGSRKREISVGHARASIVSSPMDFPRFGCVLKRLGFNKGGGY